MRIVSIRISNAWAIVVYYSDFWSVRAFEGSVFSSNRTAVNWQIDNIQLPFLPSVTCNWDNYILYYKPFRLGRYLSLMIFCDFWNGQLMICEGEIFFLRKVRLTNSTRILHSVTWAVHAEVFGKKPPSMIRGAVLWGISIRRGYRKDVRKGNLSLGFG